MTRRFWSLNPSPAPVLVRRPRLAASAEDGLAPTRRWFLGALGLVVAAPTILTDAIAAVPDVVTAEDLFYGGARGGGKSELAAFEWVWQMHPQQHEAWVKVMREMAHLDKRKLRRLKRKGTYRAPGLVPGSQADLLFGGKWRD